MATKTITTCDNCGEEITGNEDRYMRFVYPSKIHDGLEAIESNDICATCFDKVLNNVRSSLKNCTFNLTPDARDLL